MAELNLKQITDRLNAEFASHDSETRRKLVFWYDDHADFVDDIDSMELENAKVLKLEEHNQFKTKYFLERQDTKTNYLIYAPFPKPDVHENHLEDLVLYSKRFYADRASLLSVDLGIDERFKPVIEKHIKFFANKDRTRRFYDLEIENFNEENILLGIMSAICRTRTCSFEEVVRVILTDDGLEDNKFLAEFEKYDLLSSFWRFCEQQFGYVDPKPTLEKLVVTLFVTYADRYITEAVPEGWKSFVSTKPGNIIAFLDSLMNNVLYRTRYDELSKHVANGLNAKMALSAYAPESLAECDCFAEIDEVILGWIRERLQAEDTGAKLGEHSIPEVCEMRQKMHFGTLYSNAYQVLNYAYDLILSLRTALPDGFKNIIKAYQENLYQIDTSYRGFYYCLDQVSDSSDYEQLRVLIENIYTNEYLGKLLPKWNTGIMEKDALLAFPLQRQFYHRYIAGSKDRVVVIISDAMRYEVGRELFAKLSDNPRSTVKIEAILSTLPSYTRLGMSALLPHKKIELTDDGKEEIDGNYCIDLASREAVLQHWQLQSRCVQFDSVKNMSTTALREIFTGQQVIYVYHDQIDARGEHTEDEVFNACKEAVDEIYAFIEKIHNGVNSHHFIVTADHGFIYKRDKFVESEKIGGVSGNMIVKRRYIVSHAPITEDGVCNLSLGYILGNDDDKIVSFPVGVSVFKAQGSGGQNYVHGGSSPQEMLVPVVEVRMERGKAETKTAQIMLVSLIHKITNLITTLDFIQSDAVSDVVKSATYRLYFIAEDGTKISNENLYVADNREEDAAKRIFRMRFTFKNQKYDKNAQYYLVAVDENTGIEALRHPVVMDLAFAGNFGFDI